ncbi:hypothetical protein GUJ93_ZPchr0013g37515 [Zizania palustris]|uniref:Uncharacterized protein n=1 Tax=Zizania palustris TaxID=103762 RepID=A0A8J6BVP8_ZIZPA|nr:hypothetical protein GUJ93_ZPchr0013g37515 [Zizania palustris]
MPVRCAAASAPCCPRCATASISPRRTGNYSCARVAPVEPRACTEPCHPPDLARISRHSASHRDHLPHARSVALPVAESRQASDRSSSDYRE